MKIKTTDLLDDLAARTEEIVREVEALKELPVETLNKKASAESWSALEAIEHLNLYSDFYMPEIAARISASTFRPGSPDYKGGVLGNYFANSVADKPKLNKMKTFADKNPNGSALGIEVLEKFLDYQKETLELLKNSREVDLRKTRTSISISKTIKLRLGDTWRVLIYHNQRHVSQAKRAEK
jgi:hypothetical protein